MLKWIILAYFAKHWTNHALIFCAFGRKTQFIANFQKIFENISIFIRKLLKMPYFSIFFKKFNKPWVTFLRVWAKNTICWKFWENVRNFEKFFVRKLRKCIILEYFSKDLTKYRLNFRAFWRKNTFYWKFLRKSSKIFIRILLKMNYIRIFS